MDISPDGILNIAYSVYTQEYKSIITSAARNAVGVTFIAGFTNAPSLFLTRTLDGVIFTQSTALFTLSAPCFFLIRCLNNTSFSVIRIIHNISNFESNTTGDISMNNSDFVYAITVGFESMNVLDPLLPFYNQFFAPVGTYILALVKYNAATLIPALTARITSTSVMRAKMCTTNTAIYILIETSAALVIYNGVSNASVNPTSGTTVNSANATVIVLVKYSLNGAYEWSRKFSSSGTLSISKLYSIYGSNVYVELNYDGLLLYETSVPTYPTVNYVGFRQGTVLVEYTSAGVGKHKIFSSNNSTGNTGTNI
jgi:hypothetical protein